jgi:hypothetical protein
MYDKSYLTKYARYDNTERGDAIRALRLRTLRRASNGTERTLLDFGCATGSFLRLAKGAGWLPTGYDINPYGDYTDPSVLFDRYGAATMWDVVEHLPDPVKLLKGLKTQTICICTPDTDDFHLGKHHLDEWHHYYPGEHVHYYNEQSLRRLLKVALFECVSVHHEESAFRTSGGNKNIITISGRRY